MTKRIYADHSATTPLKKEVLDAMMPYLTENFGNASSIYAEGRECKKAVELAYTYKLPLIEMKKDND